MKKLITTVAASAACLALCAAVWLQNEPAVETSASPTSPAVIAAQPEVPELPEIEEIIMPEEEKSDVTQPEPVKEAATALGSSPIQATPSGEVQASPEQNATPPQEPGSASASSDSSPYNMVYVPGFGWIESQGPMLNTPRTCTRTAIKSASWDKRKAVRYQAKPGAVPLILFPSPMCH